MRSKVRRAFLIIASLALLFVLYSNYIRPTRVALVNFRDFQYADFLEANTNPFIRVSRVDLSDERRTNLNRYSVVYLFGMGLRLNEVQTESIARAMQRGAKVYAYASTSMESDLTNLTLEELEKVDGYFSNGGRTNIRRLLNYSRRVLDNKLIFSEEVKAPFEIPADVFFHLGDETFFTDFAGYQAFYEREGLYTENRPRVSVVTTNIGPRNANRAHVDMLIKNLEEKGLNVYPFSGFEKRLEFLEDIDPSLVVLLPHGRFVPGKIDQAREWLIDQNIPVLAPLTVFEPYEEWLEDQRGISGGMLSQSIVVPELDGAKYPYTIAAQFEDRRGLNVFKGIPGRIEIFSEMVKNWTALQEKSNSEKKVAIYYYKGPGLNSMVAGGMEVAPSLLNLLRELKKSGYETGPLPEDETELLEIIQKKGSILGPYAKGAFAEYLDTGRPAKIPAGIYSGWAEKLLAPEMYRAVVENYGDAPGEYMNIDKGDEQYLAVTRILFGNIALLPQPLPGYGEDTFTLIHGAETAPPHPYVASYLWAREEFGADAIMHFGTHGSLEFTPWKQSALSQFDWPDALVGGMPHFYVYVINNIGEAVIAKRRSYAGIISHLTPPFGEAGMYGDLEIIHDRIHLYEETENQLLKQEYKETIRRSILDVGLYTDLGWDDFEDKEFTKEKMDRVHDYIHTLEEAKITLGLYTLGENYDAEDLKETARLMAIDPLSYSMSQLDLAAGRAKSSDVDDPHYFDERYRQKASYIIESVLSGERPVTDFIKGEGALRSDGTRIHDKDDDGSDFMADMMQLGEVSISTEDLYREHDKNVDDQKIRELTLEVVTDPEKRDYLLSLKDESNLRKALLLQDPRGLARARRVARFIPEMKKAIDLSETKELKELVSLMVHPNHREKIFEYISDEEALDRIKAHQEQIRRGKTERFFSEEYSDDLFLSIDNERFSKQLDEWDLKRLRNFIRRIAFYLENEPLRDMSGEVSDPRSEAVWRIINSERNLGLVKKVFSRAENRYDELIERNADIERLEGIYNDTLFAIERSYDSLAGSGEAELASVINALSGGYIEPSSGGDPIVNPGSVPTGRNLYSIDAERTPNEEAWRIGKRLADALIQTSLETSGKYPRKVAFTLWGGEFIRQRGITLAQIFHLLGVEPVRNSRGVVHDVRAVPTSELGRPRIDVVVQTSGQFRDVAASRIYLINKAVEIAAADMCDEHDNFVRKGSRKAEEVMIERGFSPLEARQFSNARVFGGVGGNYGTAIGGLVESGDQWEDDTEITDRYLKNMGAIYSESHWGHFQDGIFEAALQGTDTIVQPRSSNVWGPLSLDHVYEFMGGLNATIRNVTGRDPDAYFSDLRNRWDPRMQGAGEAIWTETRTTLFNPKYIGALMEGGASSAEVFAETFRNTYGWNVMKPDVIDQAIWEGLYDIYVEDSYELDIQDFFEERNPYALQEMTAVMLETIRKEYWQADEATVAAIAELHARLVTEHDAGCSGFVCDNARLQEMIAGVIGSQLREAYRKELERALVGESPESKEGMTLEKERLDLESLKEVVEENLMSILFMLLVMGLLSYAVIHGGMKHRG